MKTQATRPRACCVEARGAQPSSTQIGQIVSLSDTPSALSTLPFTGTRQKVDVSDVGPYLTCDRRRESALECSRCRPHDFRDGRSSCPEITLTSLAASLSLFPLDRTLVPRCFATTKARYEHVCFTPALNAFQGCYCSLR